MQDFQDFQDDVFRSGTVFLCDVRDQASANYRGVFGSVAVFLCPCRGGRRVSHKCCHPENLVHLANPAQFSIPGQSSCVLSLPGFVTLFRVCGRRASHKCCNPGNLVNLEHPAQFSVQERSSCVPAGVRHAIQGLRKTCISQVR